MGLFGKKNKKEEKVEVQKVEEKKNVITRDENGFINIEIEDLFKMQDLGELDDGNGEACFASDKITKHGSKVGYMYREEPSENMPDSGWRFMAGDEDNEYINDPDHIGIFEINTICNYDPSIIPHLDANIDATFVKKNDNFVEIKSK